MQKSRMGVADLDFEPCQKPPFHEPQALEPPLSKRVVEVVVVLIAGVSMVAACCLLLSPPRDPPWSCPIWIAAVAVALFDAAS